MLRPTININSLDGAFHEKMLFKPEEFENASFSFSCAWTENKVTFSNSQCGQGFRIRSDNAKHIN